MQRQRSLRDLAGLVIGLLAVLYPFLVYWGIERLTPRILGGIILVLALIRVGTIYQFDKKSLRRHAPLFAAIILSPMMSIALNNSRYLLFIPALSSLAFFAAIGQSLICPPTFIETFARSEYPELPPSAVRYCRIVTIVWCVFLALNTLTITLLATLAPRSWWALYSGLINYILMGVIFLGEMVIRRHFKPIFDAEMAESEAAAV